MAAVRIARTCRFVFAFMGGLAVLLPPRLITHAIWPGRSSLLSMAFCRVLLWGLGLRITERPPIADRALIVANHVSWTDIIVLASIRPLVFVAKSEVKGWPVLGWLARLNGTIFIRRDERHAALTQVTSVASALGRGPVVLFAEGTTSNGDDVLPFRSTLFAAAEGRSVQPVSLDYSPRGRPWRLGERAMFAWDGDKTFWPHLLLIAGADSVACSVTAHAPLVMRPGRRKEVARECREVVRSAIAAQRAVRTSV